jgi:hypothetical protein
VFGRPNRLEVINREAFEARMNANPLTADDRKVLEGLNL